VLTAEWSLEPRKFSVDAGMSRQMMLRRHCQASRSRSWQQQPERLSRQFDRLYNSAVGSEGSIPLQLAKTEKALKQPISNKKHLNDY